VQRLEAELGRYALLDATWRATLSTADQPSKGARAASCTFQADERVPTGYAGIVEGYQRAIGGLAEAVVAVLTSLADGSDVSCH